MEDQLDLLENEVENVPSTQSAFPPHSHSSLQYAFSELPPSYTNQSLSSPNCGMPYPKQYSPTTLGMGCPQPNAPPPGGLPYYSQQGVINPGPKLDSCIAPRPQRQQAMENQRIQSDDEDRNPPQPDGQPLPTIGYGRPQPDYVYDRPLPYSAAVPRTDHPSQQQQQQVVVGRAQLQEPTSYIVDAQTRLDTGTTSMTGAIILSCIVFWLCGFWCGKIAFILALRGKRLADAGDTDGAIQLRKASYIVSIIGIFFGIIIITVLAVYLGSFASKKTNCRFYDYFEGTYYCHN